MKILVAPNAFKGSLTADDAAHVIARTLREIHPDAAVVELPLADGGNGTLDALVESTWVILLKANVPTPTGNASSRRSAFWVHAISRRARVWWNWRDAAG